MVGSSIPRHRRDHRRAKIKRNDIQRRLNARVHELEKALKEATTKVAVYAALLEVAKEKTGIDIKKNFGSTPSSACDTSAPNKT